MKFCVFLLTQENFVFWRLKQSKTNICSSSSDQLVNAYYARKCLAATAPLCDLNNCLQDTRSISSGNAVPESEDKSIGQTTYLQWDYETNKFVEKSGKCVAASPAQDLSVEVSQPDLRGLASPTSNLITTTRNLHISSNNLSSQPTSPINNYSKYTRQETVTTPVTADNDTKVNTQSPSNLLLSSSSVVSKIKNWLKKPTPQQQQQQPMSEVSSKSGLLATPVSSHPDEQTNNLTNAIQVVLCFYYLLNVLFDFLVF